jgi:hypothetical protein
MKASYIELVGIPPALFFFFVALALPRNKMLLVHSHKYLFLQQSSRNEGQPRHSIDFVRGHVFKTDGVYYIQYLCEGFGKILHVCRKQTDVVFVADD